MAMCVSDAMLDGMGFRQLKEGESLAAQFYSIRLYEIRGAVLADDAVLQSRGAGYTAAVGKSANSVTRTLAGDDLTTDETAWAKERRCRPPYAALRFGPTPERQGTGRHVKEEDGTLVTYDSFDGAKGELRHLEAQALPAAVASLACAFGSFSHDVKVLALDHFVYGVTSEGRILKDVRLQFSASAYASRVVPPEQMQAALDRASTLSAGMAPKVARFVHLGLMESDRLKRFLYFFLAVEITTNAAFAAVDHASHIGRVLMSDARIGSSLRALLGGQQPRWKNLKDKFVWSAACAWPHVTDEDVKTFTRLKRVRDSIAHGDLSEPPADAVADAEKLAMKLLVP